MFGIYNPFGAVKAGVGSAIDWMGGDSEAYYGGQQGYVPDIGDETTTETVTNIANTIGAPFTPKGYDATGYWGTKAKDFVDPYVAPMLQQYQTIPTHEQYQTGVAAKTLEEQKNPGFKGMMQRFLPGGETGYEEGAVIPEGAGAKAFKKMGGLFDFVGDMPTFEGFGGASEKLKAMLGNRQQRTYMPPVTSPQSPFYEE